MEEENIIWLKVGQIVKVDNRLYEVVLRKWSNGFKLGYTAGLNLLKSDSIINLLMDYSTKEKIKESIKDVELKPEDLPIDENNIIPKDIFKDIQKEVLKDGC
jgi:hypothetical protein